MEEIGGIVRRQARAISAEPGSIECALRSRSLISRSQAKVAKAIAAADKPLLKEGVSRLVVVATRVAGVAQRVSTLDEDTERAETPTLVAVAYKLEVTNISFETTVEAGCANAVASPGSGRNDATGNATDRPDCVAQGGPRNRSAVSGRCGAAAKLQALCKEAAPEVQLNRTHLRRGVVQVALERWLAMAS